MNKKYFIITFIGILISIISGVITQDLLIGGSILATGLLCAYFASEGKRINKNRNVFPTDMSLLKVLYLSTLKAEKKWSFRAKNWDLCLSQFRIMYEVRI